MKKLLLIFPLLIIASVTMAQTNQPKVNIKVNKKYDDNGNLISYDSSYVMTWSNTNSSPQQIDSILNHFGISIADTNLITPFFGHFPDFPSDIFFKDFGMPFSFFNNIPQNDTLHHSPPISDDLIYQKMIEQLKQIEKMLQQPPYGLQQSQNQKIPPQGTSL